MTPAPTPVADLDPQVIARLHRHITEWFATAQRDLPWRAADCSPWGVLVSEIMLQQTPVVRVLPRWLDWMRRWPTPADLAQAPTADVLRAWERLGYPRRALRLQAAAQAIVERHAGQVPPDHSALLALPGVGSYTAAAVAVFAFGDRQTVIDTNIRRVHARVISGVALRGKSLTAAETRLAERLMPKDRALSVRWNQAVMELGALICTARSPKCAECPVAADCAWLAAGSPPPEMAPRGQAWHGTDRQVRGAVMAVLRAADVAVPEQWLTVAQEISLDDAGSTGPVKQLEKLLSLDAPPDQRRRAVDGLVSDGLAIRTDSGIRLP
ncbi:MULTISPECIES: Fe-S cluster assembly protein HesB [Kocuria]|uniref:Adenine DNA glycosylase n=1 Tax=Kocuria subflava TaxID=1736139 RepID=A0A846TPI9_9MICC|nr:MULTISPECIES: Fe-S cluster assembly protein HesB [Kocuria]NKE10353.1 A/G-specific adenine glycosylase [Kocuria subflava]